MKQEIKSVTFQLNYYNYKSVTNQNIIRTQDQSVMAWKPKQIIILTPKFPPLKDDKLVKYRVWIKDITKIDTRGGQGFYFKVSFYILESYELS